MPQLTLELDEKTKLFFDYCYDDTEGWACLARRTYGTQAFEEVFFKLPEETHNMAMFVGRHRLTSDLWFCPNVFSSPHRRKEYVSFTPTAWSDLDGCHPDNLLVPPTIVIESSPGRFAALWHLERPVSPLDAEDISRKIAYHHSEAGADKSGWDLTQLLRIPNTKNFKYGNVTEDAPIVQIRKSELRYIPLADFEVYPDVEEYAYTKVPFPENIPDREEILASHRLTPSLYELLGSEPGKDWSAALWRLERGLFEAGLTAPEVFTVVRDSNYDKYKRDGRSEQYLWREVCRAQQIEEQSYYSLAPSKAFDHVNLLSDDEREHAAKTVTIIEDYIEWAKSLGDAAWQYHQAGGFTLLSSVLASYVKLPTSFGTMKLNLWFLLMGDTTLTRKTTAMDIAMDLLSEITPDAVLATDGSIEGLFSALAARTGQSSIFLRDEFSGLLDMMSKKDYYSGMAESFTKLYDGKYQKRVLRREVIEIKDPVFILFTGGIKSRILEQLNFDFVTSGFLPRFVLITAEADITRLRPLGPPTVATDKGRARLLKKFMDMKDFYSQPDSITINGKTTLVKKEWHAELTPDAWYRYNRFEAQMLQQAQISVHKQYLMPTFDRLSKTGLKVATLLAASRCEPKVIVTEEDMVHAFYYVEKWQEYSLEVLTNIGKSVYERTVDSIDKMLHNEPGITRAAVMRNLHLTSRYADDLLTTIEQRGMMKRVRHGKGEKLFPFEFEVAADE